MPVLIGWAAMGAVWDLRIAGLFGIVFFWQFPHFMAIAWRWREDYRAADMQMLPVVDPTGRRAAVQAVLAALALLPTATVPFLAWPQAVPCAVLAQALNVGYLWLAYRFLRERNDTTAGGLLRGSLIYLPVMLLTCALRPWF
jgi:protoheme IX farnesyltransferase